MTLQQRVHLRREALEAERDAGQAADVHGVDVRLAALGAVPLTHGRLQLLTGLQQRAQLTCGRHAYDCLMSAVHKHNVNVCCMTQYEPV